VSIAINVSAPGAIPDLDTLTSTVLAYLDRTTDDNLPIAQFVQLAEAMFNRELRCPEMEATVTFSSTGADTNLPSDYLAMRAIYEQGSPNRPLKAMAPSAIWQEFDGTADTPVGYCLVSGGIRLVPPPSSTVLLTMDYWAQIPALSVYAPSNWLLEKHPDAYLYSTLFQAEAYLDNSTRAGQWSQLSTGVLDRINRRSQSDRFGAGPLVPNTVVQVRGGRC
jgi:hypothetical protein